MGKQMGDDFGIGFRGEEIALGLQFGPQFGMVFNDAVVHHRDFLATHVRVRVAFRRHAVGGPAGVRNPETAFDRIRLQQLAQHGDLADRTDTAQAAIGLTHGNTGRVVAAILKALQTFDQNGHNIALSDGADDAAHRFSPISS